MIYVSWGKKYWTPLFYQLWIIESSCIVQKRKQEPQSTPCLVSPEFSLPWPLPSAVFCSCSLQPSPGLCNQPDPMQKPEGVPPRPWDLVANQCFCWPGFVSGFALGPSCENCVSDLPCPHVSDSWSKSPRALVPLKLSLLLLLLSFLVPGDFTVTEQVTEALMMMNILLYRILC